MIRTTVPLVLLAMLGGGALGLWVGAPQPSAAPPFSPAALSRMPVQQQRPALAPPSRERYPELGWRANQRPFEADV
ncbi:hypothetical protein [Pseudogulbenkiania subflava]|uniref:Uncharacterized protein n=1 Tax=Pseudogulbenkiania subflava DSM 22618 TaxID=1123014 RepID=A0A1Y6BD77_9NEIS|nr:hypothetical protein [Pseudogulbenkiania subflava]SME94702.1 hypothetical protein SAMN02745746_00281 [Pseudogulbenkiania subflava DSM 22618]